VTVNCRLPDENFLFPEMLYDLVYRNMLVPKRNKVLKNKPALLGTVICRTPGFHVSPFFPVLDLFDNPVGYLPRLVVFQAKAPQNHVF
jgi:hypothetical protein